MRIYQTTKGRFCTIVSPTRYLYGKKEDEEMFQVYSGFEVKGEVLSFKSLEEKRNEGWDVKILNPKVKFLSDGNEAVLHYNSIRAVTHLKVNVVTKELLDFLSNNKIPYDAVLLK